MQQQNQENSPRNEDEPATQRAEYKNAGSPTRPSPARNELEYDDSPSRDKFNTQRAQKLKTSFNGRTSRMEQNQHTPETIRRDSKAPAHIRMSSNPQIIQFAQGGQDEEQKIRGNGGAQNNTVEEEDIMFEHDKQRELLSSEIDIVSRVDQFRSSTTSLQGMVGEQMPNGMPNSSAELKIVKQETKFKFPEKAMPLITVNPSTNLFEVNPEAMEFLGHIKGPIGVVSVAGMYRTGKSYLLNRVLLNRQGGFGVGPSIHPCTKGIHIWGAPVSGFTATGEPVNVLVVDSEGLGGLDEDNNHDMRIFSLALLISSFFIYNSMGQIDEAAISSLSLVVNLTKHIQTNVLKGHQTDSAESAPSNLESILPNFLWVVRDFSLQLEDENGNEIQANEYLENALSQRSRDPNDPKNKIRQALQSYFKTRDCQTMVRPLVNEDQLQSLEELEIESLRAEFIEQVMELRKKVLHQMPIKKVLGHSMDGKTWAGMLVSYVEQINTGKVPNIESSWHNICQSRAQKGLTQAIEQFQREVDQSSMPANISEVEKLLQDAERTAIRDLKKELVGDQSLMQELIAQFQQIISQKSEELRLQNELACQEFCQQMLMQLFSELEQVKQAIIEDPFGDSFQQVDFALRELSNYYESNCYQFAEKTLYLAEAKTQFMAEILNIQSRQLIDQGNAQDEMENQMKDRLQTQLREAREEARQEKEKLEAQSKQYLLQKSELEANNQILTEQLDNMKEAKQKDDEENGASILKLRSQLSGVQEESRTSKEAFEDQIKEIQRSVKQSQSEFDKQKALMDQKILYLEQSLKEKTDKERDSTTEWRTQKAELSQEIKLANTKFETDIKLLTKQLEEEKEKTCDLELQLHEQTERLENGESCHTEIEETLRTQLTDCQNMLKEYQSNQSQQKQENEGLLNHKLKKCEAEIKSMKSHIEELESKVKESYESQMQVTHNSKKDIAMRDQQIEFLTMQLKESKEQLEESQRQHQQMVEALNKNNEASDDEGQSQARLELLQKEFNAISEGHLGQISDLTSQNEQLAQKLFDTEHQSRLALTEAQHKFNEAKVTVDDLTHAKVSLSEKLKQLEQSKGRLTEESESLLAKARLIHERELQERVDELQKEQQEANEQAQSQLGQMKNFYEMEKTQLEARINEEKERATRRIQTIQEEVDAKIAEATREKDIELEYLQDQLQNLEQHSQSYSAQIEHELTLKQQVVENLERQLNESRDRLQSAEMNKNSSFEKQVEHFESQRVEMNARIDKLMTENLDKDKQIASLTHKLDRNTDALTRKTTDLEQNRDQMDKEKIQFTERLESTRAKLQEVQDEAMQLKLETGREQALLTQQVEFLNRKIEELQKTNEDSTRIFDDKIKSSRQEIFDESQSQVERVTSEKELWESKYEQKRKAFKELENSLGRKNSDLEKQINQLKSQLQKLEQEKIEASQHASEEIQYLQTQLANLDTSADQAYHFGSVQAEDLAKIKAQLQETEREYQDLQSNYDRDKALWEGKVMFLETQKDNYKRDLVESQRKFEVTLEQLQKRGNHTKEKNENNQNAIMKAMENKYKTQIKEIMETHQALSQDSKNKIKRLETELQTVTERLSSTTQNRFEEVGSLEKRYTETQQNEEKLAHELEELKNERNRRVAEYQQQIDKEREQFKQRLYDSEKKAKETEQKRATLLFSVEKERANWVLEEDQLKRKVTELEENIQSLENKLETQKKEIDRLRQDLRATGASSGGPPRKPFLFAKPSQGSPSVNQSASAQGASKYLLNKCNQIQSNMSSSGSVAGNQAYTSQGTSGSQIPNTANNIINAAINRLKESKLQKVGATGVGGAAQQSQQHSETFGPKSLALKQSTSQSSLGAATSKRRDLMTSPDSHFGNQSSMNTATGSNTFGGASRGSQNSRVPFGQTVSGMNFNMQSAANQALAGINGAAKRSQDGGGNKLILGLARGSSRGGSNGRDRYRNSNNTENFEATSQDNSQM